MGKEKIGKNAGLVWRMLHELNDRENFEGISRKTGLDIAQTAAAIGWLAREDKILIQNEGAETYFTVYRERYY